MSQSSPWIWIAPAFHFQLVRIKWDRCSIISEATSYGAFQSKPEFNWNTFSGGSSHQVRNLPSLRFSSSEEIPVNHMLKLTPRAGAMTDQSLSICYAHPKWGSGQEGKSYTPWKLDFRWSGPVTDMVAFLRWLVFKLN